MMLFNSLYNINVWLEFSICSLEIEKWKSVSVGHSQCHFSSMVEFKKQNCMYCINSYAISGKYEISLEIKVKIRLARLLNHKAKLCILDFLALFAKLRELVCK